MIEKIFDVVKSNLKNPRLYIFLLVVMLVFLLLFPYIDANFFYYRRVNNRIDILTKITAIDRVKVQENEILKQEYDNLLTEIEKQTDGSIGSVFVKETDPRVQQMKFITGGSLIWITAVAVLFSKANTKKNRIISFVVLIIVGFLTGGISKIIPTIITPMVNYVGFPLLIIILVALLMTGNTEKKGEEKS